MGYGSTDATESAPDSGVRAAIEAVERLKEPKVELVTLKRGDESESMFAVVPKDRNLVSVKPLLDEYLSAPDRIEGTAEFTALESFIEHTKRFSDDGSAVFLSGDRTCAPKLTTVFDYSNKVAPRFGKHRSEYLFPVSEEWANWHLAQRDMDQTAFARLLEDRILDVLHPDAAGDTVKQFGQDLGIELATPQKLMELSRGLSVRVDQRVERVVNLSTGEGQMNFTEAHNGQDGTPLKVPGGFALAIPVFRNGPRYQVPVRLRYRVQGGAVVWKVALYRTDIILQDATEEASDLVASETGLPVYRGTPEA